MLKVILKKNVKKVDYTNNGKTKNGPIAERRKNIMPIAVMIFWSSIIPLMINRILKNPMVKGNMCENSIINPFAINIT